MQQFTPSLGAGETALAAHLPLFDRLSTLFQSMKQQQAAASILQQAWVPLDVALLRGATDRSAVERLCRCGGGAACCLLHGVEGICMYDAVVAMQINNMMMMMMMILMIMMMHV
jgi:hypothetical protein